MFASPDMLNTAAKRLAMLANDKVGYLAQAVTGRDDYRGEVTGTVLGLMPHVVEKAILTSQSLPADIAVGLCERFVNEYEAVVKMVSSAGFSNPIKRTLFNAGFHTMFRREYNDLKPKIHKLWESARMEQANPVDYLAYIALKRVEAAGGYPLESDQTVRAAAVAMDQIFERVHAVLKGA
jgi:hypothetical protein